jgi:hypothetical protein
MAAEEVQDDRSLRRDRMPLEIVRFHVVDDHLLQVFYSPLGGNREPGDRVAEVRVQERTGVLAIWLTARPLTGIYPDGATAAFAAVLTYDCIALRLTAPINDRRIVDGHRGRKVHRLDTSARAGEDDRAFQHAANHRGCPIWVL